LCHVAWLQLLSCELCAVQEPTHKDAKVEYVVEDMQVMSDFELHKLCLKYEVCEILYVNLNVF